MDPDGVELRPGTRDPVHVLKNLIRTRLRRAWATLPPVVFGLSWSALVATSFPAQLLRGARPLEALAMVPACLPFACVVGLVALGIEARSTREARRLSALLPEHLRGADLDPFGHDDDRKSEL